MNMGIALIWHRRTPKRYTYIIFMRTEQGDHYAKLDLLYESGAKSLLNWDNIFLLVPILTIYIIRLSLLSQSFHFFECFSITLYQRQQVIDIESVLYNSTELILYGVPFG